MDQESMSERTGKEFVGFGETARLKGKYVVCIEKLRLFRLSLYILWKR